jgi:DUF917 family protein
MLTTTCIELGLIKYVVARPLRGEVIKEFVILTTISQSRYLGHAVHACGKEV